MQVSQIEASEDHVVIGGGKAHSFGMSDSPEFFRVLSNSLYSDKILAVVREVVCNAQDAHIMVDKQDIPVRITIDETEFSVQDFGPGIPEDRIVDIYCVYGASTKSHDGKQTGGFGLGSKAPFAYTGTFTVINCHAGFKTVYTASLSGDRTGGKPEMREIVRTPTTETGVTVKVPLQKEDDCKNFTSVVKSVVLEGGIFATLNGQALMRYNWTKARERGWSVLPKNDLRKYGSCFCLYGSVIYPVNVSPSDKRLYEAFCAIHPLIDDDSAFVLCAPPHSVGVTPSREALSYTDLTVSTLISLMKKVNDYLTVKLAPVRDKIIAERAAKFDPGSRMIFERPRKPDPSVLKDLSEEDRMNLSIATYQVATMKDTKYVAAFFSKAAKAFPQKSRLFRRAAGEVAKPSNNLRHSDNRRIDYLTRKVCFTTPLRTITRITTRLGITENLALITRDDRRYLRTRRGRGYSVYFAQTGIVIAQRLNDVPAGNNSTARFAIILKNEDKELIGRIEAEAKKFGIEVSKIAFTEPKARKNAEVTKRVKGQFFSYEGMTWNNNGQSHLVNQVEMEPLFYVPMSGSPKDARWKQTSPDIGDIQLLSKEIRERIAVVFTGADEKRAIEAGAKPLVDGIVERFESMMLRNRSTAFFTLMDLREIYPHGYHFNRCSTPAETLSVYIHRDPTKLAPLLLDPALKRPADHDEVVRLAKTVRSIARSGDRSFQSTLNKAKELIDDINLSNYDRVVKRFPFFRFISGIDFGDQASAKHIAGIFELLNNHFSQSKTVLKEAA